MTASTGGTAAGAPTAATRRMDKVFARAREANKETGS